MQCISFDVPYPPTYGGVIDVWHRLRALADEGVDLYLHCFHAHRPPAPELEEICREVHYYPRQPTWKSLPIRRPYITASRRSGELLKRLASRDVPIWFEGMHSCAYLDHPALKEHKKFVRMHNIEWQYYQQLAARESDWQKRLYMKWEARQLKRFESVLWAADRILTISPADQAYFEEKYVTATYLPAFHSHTGLSSLPGKGSYCLYHAKLSVAENHEAAMFLVEKVFSELNIPLIIAGSEPRPELIYAISLADNVTLRHDPGSGEMFDLMREAHIHVLPTFQSSGIKLKLLNALYCGRFVVVNEAMAKGSGLEQACLIAQDARDFRDTLRQLFDLPFTEMEKEFRRNLLAPFSVKENAKEIMGMLEG